MIVLATAGAALGCDQGTPRLSNGGKGPAPQVLWTYPPNEAMNVPLQTSVRVQFDRFLAPVSAIRQTICIQAATVGPGQATDSCIGGLFPEYDPVDRVAVWKGAALVAGTRYNVRLLVPQNDDDPTGVRALDGVPLEGEFRFAFTTALANPDPAFTEPNRAITFCSNSAYCALPTKACTPLQPDLRSPNALVQSCAIGLGCHSQPINAPIPAPVGFALYLGDGTDSGATPAAVQQLVDHAVVATETAVGPDPGAPRRSPKDVFGVNMPFIDANNPGNSYLLYKLILSLPPRCSHLEEESANPGAASTACTGTGQYAAPEGSKDNLYLCQSIMVNNTNCDAGAITAVDGGVPVRAGERIPPIVPAWVPDDQWQPPAPGEYDRLRLHIRGSGMGVGGPGAASGRQNALAISAWIAAGAQAPSCP